MMQETHYLYRSKFYYLQITEYSLIRKTSLYTLVETRSIIISICLNSSANIHIMILLDPLYSPRQHPI